MDSCMMRDISAPGSMTMMRSAVTGIGSGDMILGTIRMSA